MVKTLGDELLASASLTDDEDGPVERRSPARTLDGVEKGRGLADEVGVALHSQSLVQFPTSWQVESLASYLKRDGFCDFSAISRKWHDPCLTQDVSADGRHGRTKTRFRETEMFKFDNMVRVATATVGALVLSTLTVVAAAAPAETAQAASTVFAAVQSDVANG